MSVQRDYDLVDLQSKPARLEKHNIAEYFSISSWVNSKLMNTGISAHITQLKVLKKYKCYEVTPIIMLNEPMDFYEEHGFLTVQVLTAIWEVKEISINFNKGE